MTVYFLGAGPGDPELMTIKGRKILKRADLIIYAGSLVNDEILKYSDDACLLSSADMELEEIIEKMDNAVKEGETVVRLHTGDPLIYGAIQEQIDLLEERNINCEIVPGISSYQAAGAALKKELTLPDVSQTVILTRKEGRTPVPSGEKLAELAEHNTSMAIFLSIHMMEKVVSELIKSYPPETPVAVVYKASWPEQKIIEGNLANIAEKVNKSGISKTAMILVGDFLNGDYSNSKLYDKKFSHSYRKQDKKAILTVSFGTTYPKTRKLTIRACEDRIISAFPDFTVRRAFSSQMIIDILQKRDGINIDNPEEALLKLKKDNFSQVILQPLHLIPGTEYHKLAKIVNKYKNQFSQLKLGEPLFYKNKDYELVSKALQEQLPVTGEKEAVIFMGHGSKHPANSIYTCLDYYFKDKGLNNIWVGTVEGYPEIDSIIPQLQKRNIEKVTLMPLMLVAGDHAQNDMIGERDSWKSILEKNGFTVDTYLHGLGENKKIQKIYVNKLKTITGDFE